MSLQNEGRIKGFCHSMYFFDRNFSDYDMIGSLIRNRIRDLHNADPSNNSSFQYMTGMQEGIRNALDEHYGTRN